MQKLDKTETALVAKIANRLFRQYYPGSTDASLREDMHQDGFVGLMKAKEKYKPEKNVPFKAYAAIKIEGAIIDALRKTPQIKLPQEKQKMVKELLNAKNQLQSQGKTPSDENIQELLGWQAQDVLDAENFRVTVMSSSSNPILEVMGGHKSAPKQEDLLLNKELAAVIQKCIDGLNDETEAFILVARIITGLKLRQLADKFGCAQETIRQKEISAKGHMQPCLKKHGWDLT